MLTVSIVRCISESVYVSAFPELCIPNHLGISIIWKKNCRYYVPDANKRNVRFISKINKEQFEKWK